MAKNNSAKSTTVVELMAAKEPAALISPLKFEEGQALLQELVAEVESGDIPLDQAVQSYEVGSLLLNHLRGLLNQAEERVRVLRLDGSEVV
jgi:exodeoxyribonuclease VII small subunit